MSYLQLHLKVPLLSPSLSSSLLLSLLLLLLLLLLILLIFLDAEKSKLNNMSLKQISESAGLVVYSTASDSSTANAPFIIGLTLFSLSLTGGGSGSVFNPAALFGPALVSNKWGAIPLYLFSEFFGACVAGVIVGLVHNFGKSQEAIHGTATAANIEEIELSEADERISNRIRDSMS